jgi:hypothetical protein
VLTDLRLLKIERPVRLTAGENMLSNQASRDVMNGTPHFAADSSAGAIRGRVRVQFFCALLLLLLGGSALAEPAAVRAVNVASGLYHTWARTQSDQRRSEPVC